MNKKEELREQYEDALFGVLMDELAEDQGAELIAENQRLCADPAAAVPEELDAACRAALIRALDKKKKSESSKRAGKVLMRVAMVFIAVAVAFSGLYFGVSAFREKVSILFQSQRETGTVVSSRGRTEGAASVNEALGVPDDAFLPTWLPEGYELSSFTAGDSNIHAVYADIEGHEIKVIENDVDFVSTVDTEEADISENITVNGYSGFIVEKDGIFSVSWYDKSKSLRIRIVSDSIDRETILKFSDSFE